MDTQVTLMIPDPTYRQVEATARRMHRPVADVLVDVVVDGFLKSEAFPDVYVHPERDRMQ